jgi:hypothetical protein
MGLSIHKHPESLKWNSMLSTRPRYAAFPRRLGNAAAPFHELKRSASHR